MPINSCALMGIIATHPEYLEGSGEHQSRLTFSLRFSDRRLPKATGWIDCVAWAGTADRMSAASLARGDSIIASGQLRWSSWRNSRGERRSRIGLVLDDISRISRAPEPAPGRIPPRAPGGKAGR